MATRPNGPERSVDCGILDGENTVIAECFEKVGQFPSGLYDERPAQANAAFIVQACNSHAVLVDAVTVALRELDRLGASDNDATCGPNPTVTQLKAALALAQKEAL
jgi:hypothetical protein